MDLGLERSGMRCVWQVEIDDYCRRVLAKHWPHVRRHDDVRTFPPPEGDWSCDLIAGGFPCQDLSLAGRRAGLEGEQSGLWWEYARVIRLLRPRYVVVENVPGLLVPTESGGQSPIGCVLGELASLGYDAEWESIPASAFGSTQERFRVFIVAYTPSGAGRTNLQGVSRQGFGEVAFAASERWSRGFGRGGGAVGVDNSNAHGLIFGAGRPGRASALRQERNATGKDHTKSPRELRQRATKDGNQGGERKSPGKSGRCDSPFVGSGWWSSEPEVVRMVYGISRRLVRPAIRGLGNAVVPQVAQWIGERIIEAHRLTGV